MNLSFEIRPYRLTDRTSLIATINTICAEGQWMYTTTFEPTPMWLHALSEPDCACHSLLVVTSRQGEFIGWCDLLPDDTGEEATLGIALLEPYRNQGLGTQLLQRTLQWALQQSFRKISLLVNADNQRAIHLYHKNGFTTEQEVQPPVHAKGIWLSLSYLPNLSSVEHLRLPFEQSQPFEPH